MRLLGILATSCFVSSMSMRIIHNSLQTQATELAPNNRGSAVAMHSFFMFLGQAVGPIVDGIGLAGEGTVATLLLAGTAMALLGIATAWGLKSRSALHVPKIANRAET